MLHNIHCSANQFSRCVVRNSCSYLCKTNFVITGKRYKSAFDETNFSTGPNIFLMKTVFSINVLKLTLRRRHKKNFVTIWMLLIKVKKWKSTIKRIFRKEKYRVHMHGSFEKRAADFQMNVNLEWEWTGTGNSFPAYLVRREIRIKSKDGVTKEWVSFLGRWFPT